MRRVLIFQVIGLLLLAASNALGQIGTFPAVVPLPINTGSNASCALTDHAVDGTDQTTYTFTGRSTGTASPGRYIVVATGGAQSPSPFTISSVTVAGNAMTAAVNSAGTGGTIGIPIGIYIYGPLTTGTTADVVVTFSAGMARAGIGVWACTNLTSSTPTGTAAGTVNSDPQSTTINVSAGGALIAYTMAVDGAGATYSWAGPAEQFDETIESSTAQSGASTDYGTAQTGLTVSADNSGAVTSSAMVAAAFR